MKKNINEKILEKFIKKINIPIIVDFWANWCAPCKMVNNIIKEVKLFYKKKIKLLKINISNNLYLSEKFSIKNIPTIIIIKNKIIIKKKQGFINKEYIKNIINKLINEKKSS